MNRAILGRFQAGIWVIAIIRLLTATGFSMCIPFIALYLHVERGVPMTMVGMIILVGGVCSAGSQMVGGALSDRIGRKRLLLGAMALSVVLFAALAVLIGVSAPIPAIATIYIAGRVVLMTTQPTAAAIIADLAPADRLTEAYGVMRVGGNIGWAAGPALGGYLATFLSYGWLFGVAAVTTAAALCFVAFFLRESLPQDVERVNVRSVVRVATDGRFVTFTALSLLVFLGMAHLGSTLSVFTVDRIGFSTAEYGLLLTANGLIVVLFQYPVARVVDRVGRFRSLILGSLFYALGYLWMGWIGTFGVAVGAIAVVTIGEIIFAPTTLSVVGQLSPHGWRGRYMGFFWLSQTMGISLGPLVGGILLDAFPTQPPLIWGILSAFTFVAGVGFFVWGLARRESSSRE